MPAKSARLAFVCRRSCRRITGRPAAAATFWKCRILWLDNLGRRLKGDSFRSFAHPPQDMVAVLEEAGSRATYRWRGLGWCVVGLER